MGFLKRTFTRGNKGKNSSKASDDVAGPSQSTQGHREEAIDEEDFVSAGGHGENEQQSTSQSFSVYRPTSRDSPTHRPDDTYTPSISINPDRAQNGTIIQRPSETAASPLQPPVPIIVGPGEDLDSPLGLLAKHAHSSDSPSAKYPPSSYFPEPVAQASAPPPLQFNAFRDSIVDRGTGSRYSLAETAESQSEWGDDGVSDFGARYGRSNAGSMAGNGSGRARFGADTELHNGVLAALHEAALGSNSIPSRPYPGVISPSAVSTSQGVSQQTVTGQWIGGLDPDQQSMAGEVYAGKIVHTRPAPPPPIQEMPEPLEELATERNISQPERTRMAARTISDSLSINREIHNGSGSPRSPLAVMSPVPTPSSTTPTAEDYLQMGIDKHEQSKGDQDLSESAYYFRKSAEGGSAAGCVFYGLSLRHGWGVQRDEKQAFEWLEMGCASVMQDQKRIQEGRRDSLMPMQTQTKLSPEVIMALYEVGNCFEHSWGVPGLKKNHPDHAMAAMYYRIGAEMGDKDSQEQLAILLSQGKHGLKKDTWEAARWYRAAIEQGLSPIGLSWVYKEKYMAETKPEKELKKERKEQERLEKKRLKAATKKN